MIDRLLPAALGSLVLAAGVSPQIGSLVVSPTLTPKSVVVAGPDHVVCSFVQDGWQHTVDVSVPSNPTAVATFDAPFGDQFCDAFHTPAWGGRLLIASRFGGISLLDASSPPSLTVLDSHIQPPKYSHEGLEGFVDPTGRVCIAYSEHNVSNTGGGLRLYEATNSGTTLTLLGSYVQVAFDGNGLEIGDSGRIVWQVGHTGSGSNKDYHLAVFDTNAWTTPQLVTTVPLPQQPVPYTDVDLEKAQAPNLLGALGSRGLVAVDVTSTASPVVNVVLSSSWLHVDGLVFVPNTDLALVWGYVQIGSVYSDFIAGVDATVPGTGVFTFVVPYSIEIEDVKVDTAASRVYVLGRSRGSGDAILHVW